MKITEILSPEEIKSLLVKSNFEGFKAIFITYGILVFSFFIAASYPHPLIILMSLILIGGRQHALGVLLHDCVHGTLFKSKNLNIFFGKWFCAYPLLADFEPYQKTHMLHHAKAGTKEDPDLSNYKNYPVSKSSLKRKIFRDLSFQTGIKFLIFTFSQGNNVMAKSISNKYLWKSLLVHSLWFGLFYILSYSWLYLLWLISFLTIYMLFLRIRQVAEHANVPDLYHKEPKLNTRTTYANFFEKLILAPNHVNFHLEHHILASVPPYQLKKLHHILLKRGYYEDVRFGRNYFDILNLATHDV